MSTLQDSRRILPRGTAVSYHGSLYDWHGPYLILGQCRCPDCRPGGDVRYTLADAGWMDPLSRDAELEHVRPQSITVLEG